jgi:ribosome-associated translation inhibitor RaiA
VEARIRERFVKIEEHFDRVTHGRVVVNSPARRAPLPKFFHVKIEIGVPGHPPILVKHEPEAERAHTDPMLAVRDAFNAAMRRVDDLVARMDKPAKRERTRRRPVRRAADKDA